jgi:mRNA interferase RelE/StbE
MASYSVALKPSVEKDLRQAPRPILNRVWAKIQALSQEPIPRQSTKLAGAERLYRLRVGDYRVIYTVDHDERRVTVHYVRHRREAYRSL